MCVIIKCTGHRGRTGHAMRTSPTGQTVKADAIYNLVHDAAHSSRFRPFVVVGAVSPQWAIDHLMACYRNQLPCLLAAPTASRHRP